MLAEVVNVSSSADHESECFRIKENCGFVGQERKRGGGVKRRLQSVVNTADHLNPMKMTKKISDLNHRFPEFEQLSVRLPGEERIRQNVLVTEPITGLPCSTVHTVHEVLKRAAQISENGPFLGEIVDEAYTFTSYNKAIEDSTIIGSAVISCGAKDRVGIAGVHSVRYMIAMHGLVSFSITIVPLYHNSKLEALCEISNNCGLSLIFCDTTERAEEFLKLKKEGKLSHLDTLVVLNGEKPKLSMEDVKVYTYADFYKFGEANLKEIKPPTADDIYLLCHTSGTTGSPKGVMVSHRNLLASVGGLYTQWVPHPNLFQFGSGDVYFSFLSLAHVYEHLMQTFTMYVGGSIGIYSGQVAKLVGDIQKLRPTILSLVPRLLNKFYDHIHTEIKKKNIIARKLFKMGKKQKLKLLDRGIQRYDTLWDKIVFRKLRGLFGGRLRMITTGGAPVTSNVKNFTRIAYGCPLMEGYGQTECCAAGTLNLPFEYKADVVGAPAPWSQVKLVDVPELGYFCSEDKGEICFKGAAVMQGYYGDEELTKKTIDEEGWLHTGDIGEWKSNGGLAVIDRKNALFKMSQGDFVSPESIEAMYLNSNLLSQIFVTGKTTRSFLVAIAVVNVPALKAALEKAPELSKKSFESDNEMLSDSSVKEFLLDQLNIKGKANGLQTMEVIRHLAIVNEEWTAETGLVTPTLKLRRHLLKAKYNDIIEEMYDNDSTL